MASASETQPPFLISKLPEQAKQLLFIPNRRLLHYQESHQPLSFHLVDAEHLEPLQMIMKRPDKLWSQWRIMQPSEPQTVEQVTYQEDEVDFETLRPLDEVLTPTALPLDDVAMAFETLWNAVAQLDEIHQGMAERMVPAIREEKTGKSLKR